MFAAKHHAMDRCPWLDPQKRGGANIPSFSQDQARGTTYDVETGQVYTESTVRAPKKQMTNWINAYKTPSLVKRRHANREGAASLFDMARAKVAREMRNLTANHLEVIPFSIGKKLWDEVENR
jgi:hypothetical protein